MEMCRDNYLTLQDCKHFLELSAAERLEGVRQHKLCKGCLAKCGAATAKKCRLRPPYRARNQTNQAGLCMKLKRCRRNHHKLLHVDEEDPQQAPGRQTSNN